MSGRKDERRRPHILVGTTSWTDKTLVHDSHFYPPVVKTAEQRLRYYASVFPVVEVDSTFYAIPPLRNAQIWSERTPPDFVFDLKSYRLFTQHRTPVSSLPSELRAALPAERENVYYQRLPNELRDELWLRFRAAIEPLRASGRLGVVLFQFAPWVVAGRSARAHIAHCAERMEGFRLAVELRNLSWFTERHRERTLEFLRSLGLVHVVVDEPQGGSFSVPALWKTTSPEVALCRFHGRNREAWQRKGLAPSERYAYLYSDRELQSFAAPIRSLSERCEEVHVLFNNCHRDWAQRNARRMAELVQPSRA